MFKMIIFLMTCFTSLYCHALDKFSPCLHDLEVNFFRQEVVNEALSLYNIPQGQWFIINQQLKSASYDVPAMVTQAASRIRPNPLDYPLDPFLTQKILLDSLWQVFYRAMFIAFQNIQWSDYSQIPSMFDYVKGRQMQRLINCFGDLDKLRQQMQLEQQMRMQQQLQQQQQEQLQMQQNQPRPNASSNQVQRDEATKGT